MIFKVMTDTARGWADCWKEGDQPMRFSSQASAQEEIDDHIADCLHAVEQGDMIDAPTQGDFRIDEERGPDYGCHIRCRCGNDSDMDDYISLKEQLKGWYVCPACGIAFKPGCGKMVVMQEEGPLWDEVRRQRMIEMNRLRVAEAERKDAEFKAKDIKTWRKTQRMLRKAGVIT